jgi:MFS family permease
MSTPSGTRAASRFRALRHSNFRRFWIGQLISVIGTWMQMIAQGWLMHRLTDSALMLGLLGFTQFLPVMLFSLWAGVVADRTDKRRLIFLTQSLSLAQALVLAVLVSSGAIQPWMLLALAFVFGTVSAFDLPARQSFLIEMVGREDLTNAIALNSAAFNTARVVGPALAGVLVALAGEHVCFWVNAASYAVVLVMLARLDLPPHVADADTRRTGWGRLGDGIRYALQVAPIRNLLLLLGVTCGLGFQYSTLLPVYARDILHAGPEAYGLLMSAFGVGSLLSAVVITRPLDRWGLRRCLLIGLGCAAVGMGLFAWSTRMDISVAMGFAAGFGLILYVATTNTLLQLTTEDRFRGRVMGLYTLMLIGTAPIGALASGAIAQRYGAPVATTCNAVVLLLGAVWVAWRLRVLAAREAAHPTEPVLAEKVG